MKKCHVYADIYKLLAIRQIVRSFLILVLFFSLIDVNGQNCNTIDRLNFIGYPDSLPEVTNCRGEMGLKQGVWINNSNHNNTYSYGRYNDGNKVGVWIYRLNDEKLGEHLTPIIRIDTFSMQKDSIIVNSVTSRNFSSLNWDHTRSIFNKDSSYLQVTHNLANSHYVFKIECNSNLNIDKQCRVEYREFVLNYFPIDHLDIEIERLNLFYYERRIKEIDEMK